MMALMNALVGVGAVIYYSTDVFRAAGIGGTSGAEFASLAVGGVNFLAAVVSVFLTDRFGRRPQVSIGRVGIAVCLAVAGIILVGPGAEQGGLLVGAILGYIAFFAISAGPLAWLLLSEVLPGSKTEAFIKAVSMPVHIPLSGRTMSFDNAGKCTAGC